MKRRNFFPAIVGMFGIACGKDVTVKGKKREGAEKFDVPPIVAGTVEESATIWSKEDVIDIILSGGERFIKPLCSCGHRFLFPIPPNAPIAHNTYIIGCPGCQKDNIINTHPDLSLPMGFTI